MQPVLVSQLAACCFMREKYTY
eukprot:COSAG01_NODE_32725_length_576_cov_1.928721_1_plen_21_part_01